MTTRYLRQFVVTGILLGSIACSVSPTAPEIEQQLARQAEDELSSVAGLWWGLAEGGAVSLVFTLTQAADGRVQGNGTLKEIGLAAAPIAIGGTYGRPNLSLTFTAIYQGREVAGTVAATNAAFGGAPGTLRLGAGSDATSLSLLLGRGTAPQPSVGGRITDAVTGAPVAGATVSVQGRSVLSSTTGHYGFNPNLADGRFDVSVSHPAYLDLVRKVDIVPFATADFKLQPK